MSSDEDSARKLLEAHLRANGHTATCTLVFHDPPDIECTVDGERWAVEVTRSNEQEVLGSSQQARNHRDKPLLRFADEIKSATVGKRQFDFLLILEGPSSIADWSKWKRKTKKFIVRFIESNQSGEIKFDGGSISSSQRGSNLNVAITPHSNSVLPSGRMTADIGASVTASIAYSINDKFSKMRSVSGFDKVGLVLLNTHFFGDDIEQARAASTALNVDEQGNQKFDLIFYANEGVMHQFA